MSRSWKKVPGFSDSEYSQVKGYFLRVMNRRIRRLDPLDEKEGLTNGNVYRRFIDRWSYRDYNFRYFTGKELKNSRYSAMKPYKLRIK